MVKLNIGFFGSDKFSIHSLKLLLQLQKAKPDLINSVELITRSPKRFRKEIVDVPILQAFPGLTIHRADTKQQILDLKSPFNLIIAVSYGKLIPAKFIESIQHGGLNVHPSSLPKYSGASPIQYALMNDDKETGVSLQTLHPTKFDLGEIIAQKNGIHIEYSDNYSSLTEKLGEIGGQLLLDCISEIKFINPVPIKSEFEYSYAPRLRTGDHEVLWDKFDARHIYKRFCALGPLHTYIHCNIYSKLQKKNIESFKRVILSDLKEHSTEENNLPAGSFYLDDEKLIVKTSGSSISVGKVHMETFKQEAPEQFMTSLKKRTGSIDAVFSTKI